ncbi:hypothetical protein [Arthrobacter sp. A2-55]|uniref:hypothetical protein n=1 Tax=Arthrobacter sp. A2-55 TaxID=2897337 RepID=UPI0021CD4933|nr:hypothetical protein [Arthrobacter sp. A2-55]MCU6479114.1 hypothetical protein [Arthrobacter sp. A2-55]
MPENHAAGLPATGDAAVDALVAKAAEAAVLPTVDHNALYTGILAGLQEQLDANPAAQPGSPGPAGAL